jgi:hypothetical protein
VPGTVYRVVPQGEQWRLEHEEQRVDFATKEAAFEAAVIAAQRAIREAVAVQISVDPGPNVLMGGNQN